MERVRNFGRVRVRVGSGFRNLGPAGPGPGPGPLKHIDKKNAPKKWGLNRSLSRKNSGVHHMESNFLGIHRLVGQVSGSKTDGLVSGYETDWVSVRMVVSQNFINCEKLGKTTILPDMVNPGVFSRHAPRKMYQQDTKKCIKTNLPEEKRINTKKGLKIIS